ncbi:MAG: hypothetical protein HC817_08885 [Saprospiraceae bacterium]|nr:hypothetical protein [Saprospiraceae bacterium]
MILNPGTQCGDTIFLQMSVYESVKPDFSFSYDTCIAGPVSFRDKSFSRNGAITKWRWEFGDGNESLLKNPNYSYKNPGDKNIKINYSRR